jgi:hypothetical protein
VIGRYAALSDTVEVRAVAGRLSLAKGDDAFPITAREEGPWEIEDYPPYSPLPGSAYPPAPGLGGISPSRMAAW